MPGTTAKATRATPTDPIVSDWPFRQAMAAPILPIGSAAAGNASET